MLTKLRLERFKNFREAELHLGPFTLLVGANASGKSNLRDAFRFLHGIGRRYIFPEIVGERYGEGGALQWKGIRGGLRELPYADSGSFAIEVTFDTSTAGVPTKNLTYRLEVACDGQGWVMHVRSEHLRTDDGDYVFDTHPDGIVCPSVSVYQIGAKVRREGARDARPLLHFAGLLPILPRLRDCRELGDSERALVDVVLRNLESMRFLELSPDAMRNPSFPGQVLGDRGENLSSVLQAICDDPREKQALLGWVRELTPMDATDFRFVPDQIGRVLVNLIEEGGQQTSAYSASDGTLRFLGLLAALLGPERARMYFFEELENGIHPARLALLLQLIEGQVKKYAQDKRPLQVIASTHSPQLLTLVQRETLEHASLVYRLPGTSEGSIRRILDIPEARRVLEEQDLARLHASGWLEDAVYFANEVGTTP
jgi:predicted ATPase